MERYSGTQAMEGVPVDPVAEWAAPGGGTGLEEPMWQLGLGGGLEAYPVRPDEPDCIYFMRTGFCGYGNRCRFNHPRDRTSGMGSLRTSGGDYPERTGQPVCQYYMRTGMCKFGSTCKYHHPKYGVGSSSPITLNFYGYPSRPGEKECSHYMKTGQCRFGITCKFHHPQQTGPVSGPVGRPTAAVYPTVQSPSFQTSQQYGVISGNWPVARPIIVPGSYVPGSYGPVVLPPGVIPVPGWAPYSVGVPKPVFYDPMFLVVSGFIYLKKHLPLEGAVVQEKQCQEAPINHGDSPSNQPTVGAGPIYGITQLSPSSTAYSGPHMPIASSIGPSSSNQKEHAFPERPGEPECQYYLRTGDCKFGSTCKYHHPLELTEPVMNFSLGSSGLPLRPGMPICSHYVQSGMCRYGPSCRFDHPVGTMSYSPSASSLTDMPVAPYPVGSTSVTLAPSSSSLDLRPENISGSNKDSGPSQMSTANSSSTSVGSLLSKDGTTPQSGPQHSRSGRASSS